MATKEEKKKVIRQQIIDAAKVYSGNLAGRTFCMCMGRSFLRFHSRLRTFYT